MGGLIDKMKQANDVINMRLEIRLHQRQIAIWKQDIKNSQDRIKYLNEQIEILSINQLEIDFDEQTSPLQPKRP